MKKESKKAEEKVEKKVEKKVCTMPEDRGALLRDIWGRRGAKRLNKVLDADYCGVMTVREFVALVLADTLNFPRGLDTAMCIGDFEGNFCTDIVGVTTGGPLSDHICIMGDPHAHMKGRV